MSGTDFRNEYKSAIEELTPSNELLERISLRMEQAKAEPNPAQNRSFFSRHRAILTAAASLAVVIGICAVGAVVISHLNDMNSMTDSAEFDMAGAAVSIADKEVYEDGNGGNGLNNDADSAAILEPSAPDSLQEAPSAGNGHEINSPTPAGEYYSDDLLQVLAKKAKNGTLTIEDLGKDITIQGDDTYCQVFRSFKRDTVPYTLVADFENIDGEMRVINLYIALYIAEPEQDDFNRQIDLIKNSEQLEDFFARNASEDLY